MGARDKIMKIAIRLVVSLAAIVILPFLPLKAKVCGNNGLVYYHPFVVELYYGLTETTIEEYVKKHGCKSKINKSVFISMLRRENMAQANKEAYNISINAKLVFAQNDIYYINKNGVVRHGDDYFIIDKEQFEKNLEFISCPSR
jgi:hypothetical protein